MNTLQVKKNIENSLINKIFLEEKFIYNFIKYLSSQKEVNSYVSKIITNYGNDNSGFYDLSNQKIFVNYNKYKNFNINEISKNIEIVNCSYHEVCHAFQNKLIYDNYTYRILQKFYYTLINSFTLANDEEIYKKYYTYFLHEYHAYINSWLATIDTLNNLDKKIEQEIIHDYNKFLSQEIMKSYTDIISENTTSPIDNATLLTDSYNTNFNKRFLEQIENDEIKFKYSYALCSQQTTRLSEFDKLLFGYQLENETLNKIDKVASGKIKTLNLQKIII